MKTVDEYLAHAAECEALLSSAVSDEQRAMIRHMADTWRMLAETRRTIILGKKEGDADIDDLVDAENRLARRRQRR